MKCTHVALQVCNIDRSIAFYERYCDMQVVHRRESDGRPWCGWDGAKTRPGSSSF